jgi:hypothetical protein
MQALKKDDVCAHSVCLAVYTSLLTIVVGVTVVAATLQMCSHIAKVQ